MLDSTRSGSSPAFGVDHRLADPHHSRGDRDLVRHLACRSRPLEENNALPHDAEQGRHVVKTFRRPTMMERVASGPLSLPETGRQYGDPFFFPFGNPCSKAGLDGLSMRTVLTGACKKTPFPRDLLHVRRVAHHGYYHVALPPGSGSSFQTAPRSMRFSPSPSCGCTTRRSYPASRIWPAMSAHYAQACKPDYCLSFLCLHSAHLRLFTFLCCLYPAIVFISAILGYN